jgi:hypothetical protein
MEEKCKWRMEIRLRKRRYGLRFNIERQVTWLTYNDYREKKKGRVKQN